MPSAFAKSHAIRRDKDTNIKRPRAASQAYQPGQIPASYGWPTGVQVTPGTIVVMELGGKFYPSDMALWAAKMTAQLGFACPIPVVKVLLLPGADDSPGDADGEVMVDVERAAESWTYMTGLQANILLVYGPNSGAAFATIVNYVKSLTPAQLTAMGLYPIVLAASGSWGQEELAWAIADLNALDTAQNATVVPWHWATGDNDSNDGTNSPNVDAPACLSSGVACGGTSRVPPAGPEVVWNSGRGEGTGGGFSKIVPRPAWQPKNAQSPGGFDGRMVPDLAEDADPNTGVETVVDSAWGVIGGTSIVAPAQAGFSAVVNGARLHAGLPMLNGPAMNAALWANASSFLDCTSGNNGAYRAAAGPDPCTGLGRPLGTLLSALDGSGSTPPPLPPPVVPPPPPVTTAPPVLSSFTLTTVIQSASPVTISPTTIH
jgi:kumamolisin